MITRLTHLVWSRAAGAALLPIALALALLPSAVPALAQAQRTHLAGTEIKFFGSGAAGRSWDPGPWHQDRLIDPTIGNFDYGALAGTMVWMANDRLDFSTTDGRVWAKVTYTATSGIVCSGTAGGKLTGFLLNAQLVAQCSDGSLLRGTVQDVSNNGVTIMSTFEGELLSP